MNWDTAPQELESLRAQVAALTKRQQEAAEKFYTPNAALEAQLAAAQAQIAQLREALRQVRFCLPPVQTEIVKDALERSDGH